MIFGFEMSDDFQTLKSVNDVTFSENYITYIKAQNHTFRQYNYTLVYQELSIS